MKTLALVLVCILALTGCATGIMRPFGGDHSAVNSTLHEKIGADGSSELKIENKINGEAATERTVTYIGPTEAVAPDGTTYVASPWQLTDGVNASVTSPQAILIAEGRRALMEQLPAEMGSLLGQILSVVDLPFDASSASPATPSLKAQILTKLLDAFIARRLSTPVDILPE